MRQWLHEVALHNSNPDFYKAMYDNIYKIHQHFAYLLRNLQLTIRGSGKLKQTVTKLLALPGGIKNLYFQEQWG